MPSDVYMQAHCLQVDYHKPCMAAVISCSRFLASF